jgi:hypothetical protein
MFDGHVIVHGTRVMVKVQFAVFPEASVAVQVTVVVPTGNVEPLGGEHAAVAPGQLSVGVGVVYVTGAGELPNMLILAGQVMLGGCVSVTVTVNMQLGPAEAVQVTVVVPTVKVDPEAGAHVTVPHVPVVVGGG